MMKSDKINNLDKPTGLPKNDIQAKEWQNKNRNWWQNHPMRYDWKESIHFDEFSPEFYKEIDNRFFSSAEKFMPYSKIPFDPLIEFDKLNSKDVLEIGTGNGSHAQLLAEHSKSYTGIDITDYAVKSTSQRLKVFQLKGKVIQMDAEKMEFEDNSFDFIWTWGVIHHSSNTERILKEMHRVLKPGGVAIIMVYYRNFWNYYILNGLLRGILQGGDLFKTRSLHRTAQKFIDGAIARYYTISEWRALVEDYFTVKNIKVYGSKAALFPIPGGKFKDFVTGLVPNPVSRFFTNKLRIGNFLVSILENK